MSPTRLLKTLLPLCSHFSPTDSGRKDLTSFRGHCGTLAQASNRNSGAGLGWWGGFPRPAQSTAVPDDFQPFSLAAPAPALTGWSTPITVVDLQASFPNTGPADGHWLGRRPFCSSLVCDEACRGLGAARDRSCRVLWVQRKRFTAAHAREPAHRARPFDWRHPVGRAAEKRREGARTRQVKPSWSRLVLRRPPSRRLLVPRWTDEPGRGS